MSSKNQCCLISTLLHSLRQRSDNGKVWKVEEAGKEKPSWDGPNIKGKEMKWYNDSNSQEISRLQIISASIEETTAINSKVDGEIRTITCPSCGHTTQLQDQIGILHDLPGLPAGVKFDPSDQEILEHLEPKVLSDSRKLHPLIDEFIPTIEGENGICYTHPEKLPGVSKDGQIRHFFHRPSKAYTTGTRKRRKVHPDVDCGETRWHKTGKTRPVFIGGALKGHKKILVLYTNYGRQKKPEKTNWVMHQYHLGDNEDEKDGELVVSKVFYQTQPRQSNTNVGKEIVTEKRSSRSSLSRHDGNMVINTSKLMDYYSPQFMSYNNVGSSQIREGPPQLIQNMVVHGDGTSFIHLPSSASKANEEMDLENMRLLQVRDVTRKRNFNLGVLSCLL